jgi:hypothetical protein
VQLLVSLTNPFVPSLPPTMPAISAFDGAPIVTEMLQKLRCEAFFRKID